jgi:hypothetical protein
MPKNVQMVRLQVVCAPPPFVHMTVSVPLAPILLHVPHVRQAIPAPTVLKLHALVVPMHPQPGLLHALTVLREPMPDQLAAQCVLHVEQGITPPRLVQHTALCALLVPPVLLHPVPL